MKKFATIPEVLKQVSKRKPMTRESMYLHIRALKIRPIGEVRQIPQLYPADTAAKILKRLGLR
jgi:hypothetical protein